MNRMVHIEPGRVFLILWSAAIGATVGLLAGIAAVALAPDHGFGDRAAAAVTGVFLTPLRLVVGGVTGWGTGRQRA